MNLKLIRLGVGLAAALALIGVASASASAASWHAGGAEVLTSESLASNPESTAVVIDPITSGIPLQCEHVELKTGSISHPSGGAIGHLVLKQCFLVGGGGQCSLESETIESKPLKLEAALGAKSPEDTLLLKPESGTRLFEVGFIGESCAWFGKQAFTGQARFILPKGREELASQALEFHAGKAELRMGSYEVTLSGTAKVKLASGKTWSFR